MNNTASYTRSSLTSGYAPHMPIAYSISAHKQTQIYNKTPKSEPLSVPALIINDSRNRKTRVSIQHHIHINIFGKGFRIFRRIKNFNHSRIFIRFIRNHHFIYLKFGFNSSQQY